MPQSELEGSCPCWLVPCFEVWCFSMAVLVFRSNVLVFLVNRQPIHPAQVSPVPNGSLVPSVDKFLLSTPSSPPCSGTLSFGPWTWIFRGYYYGSPAQLLLRSLILTFTTTLLYHSTKVDSDYRLLPCNLGTLWKFLPLHLTVITTGSSWTSETQISVPEKIISYFQLTLPIFDNSLLVQKHPECKDTVTKTYTVD